MKRFFEIGLCLAIATMLVPVLLVVAGMVYLTSKGPVLYWSDRVGKRNHVFKMPKFRTMSFEAPTVATHLLQNPKFYLTPVGSFLRKTSLDELPQLWSILMGDMTFVGPRPALYNQYDLISKRTELGVDVLVPGLTGWAQINGRDELTIDQKVEFDYYYLLNRSFSLDVKILWLTILRSFDGGGVSH